MDPLKIPNHSLSRGTGSVVLEKLWNAQGEPGPPQHHGGPGASGSTGMLLKVRTEMGGPPEALMEKEGSWGCLDNHRTCKFRRL